jgi:hypothetical protein
MQAKFEASQQGKVIQGKEVSEITVVASILWLLWTSIK